MMRLLNTTLFEFSGPTEVDVLRQLCEWIEDEPRGSITDIHMTYDDPEEEWVAILAIDLVSAEDLRAAR